MLVLTMIMVIFNRVSEFSLALSHCLPLFVFHRSICWLCVLDGASSSKEGSTMLTPAL